MKKIVLPILLVCIACVVIFFNCTNAGGKKNKPANKAKHHLNIPQSGIQSMMEENTQKIIEGTDGSVIILVGEVTRKKVDITIKRDDKILDERIIAEDDKMTFDYEGNTYTIELRNIKKPLLGQGKAEITIR